MHTIRLQYNPLERALFHFYQLIPGPLQPGVSSLLILCGAGLYFWALVLMGRWAESKGQRFWLGFTIGAVNGPIIGSLFVALMQDGVGYPKRHKRRA